ncbi:MAG: DUF2461 domain-containing protein [Clostridia bacterium]|jgi:uncharacterized protein (TIGR02453 family)|nr:DUF2461 domain-containing protein [Spirochaetia bacterium]
MAFTGFGSGTTDFLHELSLNNNKAWFTDNQERYESELREPAESFILTLGPLLAKDYSSVIFDTRRNGAGSLMRIHRDVRFARDKRPYKENLGIIFPLMPGKKVEVPIFYLHIEARQAFFYGGQHVFPPEVLERYRQAVDHKRTGPALEAILSKLDDQGLRLMEDPQYKRVPREYPADHPRGGLLRQGALGVGLDLGPDELGRPGLVESCLATARQMQDLIGWLLPLNG